jgi:hypothetical protein
MSKETNHPRSATLIRASQLRSLLIAHLNQSEKMLSFHDLSTQLQTELDKLGVKRTALAAQLKHMTGNRLISCRQEGQRYFYGGEFTVEKPSSSTPSGVSGLVSQKTKPLSPQKPKVEVLVKPTDKQPLPVFKIDVIKNTQRLRIELANVIFEVGVVLE